MLEAMALGMMQQISANIHNVMLSTIMADETADVSNKLFAFGGLTTVL